MSRMQHVIVTGASRGLGEALVQTLLAAGYVCLRLQPWVCRSPAILCGSGGLFASLALVQVRCWHR